MNDCDNTDNSILNFDDVIRTLTTEIPRLIKSSSSNNDNNTDMEKVLTMIETIENGEEPIMFKICMGTATSEEIKAWANDQGLVDENIGEAIKNLQQSFDQGIKIAKKIENPIDNTNLTNNPTTETIMNRLNQILEQLEDMKNEVICISNMLRQKDNREYL